MFTVDLTSSDNGILIVIQGKWHSTFSEKEVIVYGLYILVQPEFFKSLFSIGFVCVFTCDPSSTFHSHATGRPRQNCHLLFGSC